MHKKTCTESHDLVHIYNLLKKAQDFDDVLEIIPFLSKQKKEQFIANVEKDLGNIKPYDETLSITNRFFKTEIYE